MEHYRRGLEGGVGGGGGDVSAVLTGMAEVERSRGHVNDTIRLYYEAAKVKPNDARILMNAAVVLADEQRLSEAVAAFVRAAALAPHDTLLLSNYGTVLHRMGELRQL